jgi:hypothetical protein
MNAPTTPAPEPKAPESVGWYIDLTKWLIGIAAGTLAFAFDKLRPAALTGSLDVIFWVSAVALALSIGAGIFGCTQFLGYANRRESGLAPNELPAVIDQYRTCGTRFYQACAGCLWVGIALFAIVWAISNFNGLNSERAGESPVLVALPSGTSAVIFEPGKPPGSLSVLVRDGSGRYYWQPAYVPLPVGTSRPGAPQSVVRPPK